MISRILYYEKAENYWGARYDGMQDISEDEAAVLILGGMTPELKECARSQLINSWSEERQCMRHCLICNGEAYYKLFRLYRDGEPYYRYGRP